MSESKRIYTTPENKGHWTAGYAACSNVIRRGTDEGNEALLLNALRPYLLPDARLWFVAGWNDALAGEPVNHVGIRLPPDPAPAHEHRLSLAVVCVDCNERRHVFPKVEPDTLAGLWRQATPPGGTIWPTPAPLVTESPAGPVSGRPEKTAPPGAVKPPERCQKCGCRINAIGADENATACWWCGTPWKTG